MSIQIGNYRRPGVYTEEIDNSVIDSVIQEGALTSLVIGSSRKGAVNTPILLRSVSDLVSVFGDIDRNLERKSSYFHRTLRKALESSQVYAINLLLTDDDLDRVEFKSLSTKTGLLNQAVNNCPYRRIFNTTGFWKRDTEAFLNATKDSSMNKDTIFNITNLSDKPITVFIVKSKVKGYDRPVLDFYGSIEKVPPTISATDWASDYMVDVVVISGDWSNYSKLATDSRWSRYFTVDGIKKGELMNFASNPYVNTLKYYDGLSLIPYFKDTDGKNIFIESAINLDTERSGLFCSFDVDKFDTEYYTGLVDLVGNTIINEDINDIDFLSYKFKITEKMNYKTESSDKVSNVVSSYNNSVLSSRTFYNGEGYIGNLKMVEEGLSTSPLKNFTLTITESKKVGLPYTYPYAIINSSLVEVNLDKGKYSHVVDITKLTNGAYVTYLILNNQGKFDTITTKSNYSLPSDCIIVNTYEYTVKDKQVDGTVKMNGLNKLTGTGFSGDFSNPIVNVSKNGSKIVVKTLSNNEYFTNYESNKLFNLISSLKGNDRGFIATKLDGSGKLELSKSEIYVDIADKTVTFSFPEGTDFGDLGTKADFFHAYKIDTEFSIGRKGMQTNPTYPEYGIVSKGSQFYIDYANGVISSGDYFEANGDLYYLLMHTDSNGDLFVTYTNFEMDSGVREIVGNLPSTIDVISRIGNLSQTIEVAKYDSNENNNNKIFVDASRYANVKVGDFLESKYNSSEIEIGEFPRKLTRIISKKISREDSSLIEIITDTAIEVKEFLDGTLQTTKYSQIDEYVDSYNGIVLKGFKIREESLPDGSEKRQSDILDLVSSGTSLFKALTNKETFNFRYLIDSYGLGLIENSKKQLADICGQRLDSFGFLNMPSMKSFRKSASPSFNDSEGNLKVEYITKGGNPEANASFNFSLATGIGSTSVGYFTPYLTISSDGDSIDVPPAMYVANTYLRKHSSSASSITPWTISAGINNGRINGIIGTEYPFTTEDIEFLDEAMMNPIVFKRARGNYVIETENTALVDYKSALSHIHVREVLIELERELARMLEPYVWTYNEPSVRAEIKMKADIICENYRNKKGLYEYYNQCDANNNTEVLISNQIGLLSTYVEPIMGMKYIVNQVEILQNGQIRRLGFSLVN